MTEKNIYLAKNIKLQELEARLNKFTYLSKESLPGRSDALIFEAIKLSRKIPSKTQYFNLYHWYITMSQFATKEIKSWKRENYHHNVDHLIQQCVGIIQETTSSPMKTSQTEIDYIFTIFIKDSIQKSLSIIKTNLQRVKINGKPLKFSIYKQNPEEQPNNCCNIRVGFRLTAGNCDKLKDMISKHPDVQSLQIKKKAKEGNN